MKGWGLTGGTILYSIVHNIEHMFKNMNIFATPALNIITFLGRNPRDSYYVRNSQRSWPSVPGAASVQLPALEVSGLVTSEQKGRTLLFRARYPIPLS